MSCFTFISPVSSSLVAPAIPTISKEFGVTNEISSQLMLSIFVLAYAFGPLILGPLSEIYGRVPVLQLSNLFYLAFNIACGFSQTRVQLTICRFFAGLGGSAPLAVRFDPFSRLCIIIIISVFHTNLAMYSDRWWCTQRLLAGRRAR